MSRLPIRLRLTLTFTGAVAVVFLCAGGFLYVRMQHALDSAIRSSLQTQLAQVTALVRQADTGLRQGGPATARPDSFAQVLTPAGAVVDSTAALRQRPLLAGSRLQQARSGEILIERTRVAGVSAPARILAAPVRAQGSRLIVVVGTSLAARDDALNTLLYQLLLGGPVVLAMMAAAGLLLARASLRPVERIRRDSEGVTGSVPGERVTLPAADDEIRRLGETLNRMLERLERSVEQERRFAADASHELRTPLALLRAELELALRRERSVGELETAIRSALAESRRLAAIADRLLLLARADSGALQLDRRRVCVASLVNHVAERFRPLADDLGRTLAVEMGKPDTACVDAGQVEQSLANLVDNALRHGDGRITISAQRRPTSLELAVTDQGSGFAPDFLPRAFERFSRADRARSSEGAGLGLSIVQATALAHSGTASADNPPGGGARITITIPQSDSP